jgi:hypothetical protein
MAGTLDKPTDQPTVAPPPGEEVRAPDDASRLCANCAALLSDGQDWCLECGTAQPGRLGDRPGWRPALTVVAVTAVLAAGAIAAAYAALSSEAERQASAPPPPTAQPVVPPAAAPAETTPAPAETPPEIPAPESDAGDDAPAPKADKPDPKPESTPAPSTGGSSTPAPSGDTGGSSDSESGSGGGSDSTPKEPKPEPAVIALSPGAASTYDPFDRAGGLTGDPADAIDGRRRTAWEAPVGQDGLVNIGLLVSLDRAEAFESVRLRADTPGFNVTLYGAKLGTAPEGDPAKTSAWQKLDATRDFGTDEKLDVGAGKWRHVLLWFTEQPADTKVMIPEVELRK